MVKQNVLSRRAECHEIQGGAASLRFLSKDMQYVYKISGVMCCRTGTADRSAQRKDSNLLYNYKGMFLTVTLLVFKVT